MEVYASIFMAEKINTKYSNSVELMTVVQKLTADIFIRQSKRLLFVLDGDNLGDISRAFKGYDLAFKTMRVAWGIDNLADVNAAFQCLESKGYLTENNMQNALSQVPEIHQSN